MVFGVGRLERDGSAHPLDRPIGVPGRQIDPAEITRCPGILGILTHRGLERRTRFVELPGLEELDSLFTLRTGGPGGSREQEEANGHREEESVSIPVCHESPITRRFSATFYHNFSGEERGTSSRKAGSLADRMKDVSRHLRSSRSALFPVLLALASADVSFRH